MRITRSTQHASHNTLYAAHHTQHAITRSATLTLEHQRTNAHAHHKREHSAKIITHILTYEITYTLNQFTYNKSILTATQLAQVEINSHRPAHLRKL